MVVVNGSGRVVVALFYIVSRTFSIKLGGLGWLLVAGALACSQFDAPNGPKRFMLDDFGQFLRGGALARWPQVPPLKN